MSITWPDLQTKLSAIFELDDDQGDFANYLPNVVDLAEQRIYREIDFMATRVQNSTALVTAGSRTFVVPGLVIVTMGISIVTPVGSLPANGTRNRLRMTSLDALDAMWPNESYTGVPEHFAMRDNATAILGCTPDKAYAAEVTGTVRPAPMSATNTTTYLGTNYPDLFFIACCIAVAGYQRDYGAQSEDPRVGLSWSSEYDKHKVSVEAEERRRRGLPVAMAAAAPPPPPAG